MDRHARKALKQAYKLTLPPMGIYAIRNLASGRMLIDQSPHLTGSLNRHRAELRLGTHRNKALMDDWHRLGEAGFAFEVMQTLEPRAEPDFDYAAELAQMLGDWRQRVPPGTAASYL
ncbi:GIY-YIG nuclease family protein [Dyella sp. ASV21]|uniref:GIY-YIG nuclease family protein n=1 Tax=Dyella sp. ASV21 TaxID=2795114 RepID=UPI0018EAB4C0|nr:GIY-YIG nuclease family protein [Dyella sp. ASV21]